MNGWGVVAVLAVLGITGCQPAAAVGAPKEAPAQKETEAPARKTAEAPAQKTLYRDTAQGLSFEHDPGLRVRPCDEAAGSRCVILFDPATEPFLRDLLTIQVHNGALETVAAEEAGFVRNAEGRLMTTFGRFEPVAVETVHVGGKSGLRAIITCGISDPETGFHAGAGECLWAVVGDGPRSVVISSSGFGNGLEAAEAILPSLRLLPRR